MGPRLFSRGNAAGQILLHAGQPASMGPRLFSRGNVVDLTEQMQPARFASMGPRLFSRGNLKPRGRQAHSGHLLQWGHDFSAVEISVRSIVQPGSPGASMGPRLFSRGNFIAPKALIMAALLQWGHDFSAVEIPSAFPIPAPTISRFNGATTFQPWKCKRYFAFDQGYICFNGATTFQPWKFSLGSQL